jgi:hypothetical protein
VIPEHLRFSAEERAKLDRKMADLEESERKRRLAEQGRPAGDSGIETGIIIGAIIGGSDSS